ncbi:glycerol-3-phosphate responsive antiterminator, partial [Ruminococcaceae bacterium OttesenSCG-928-L11]|nr:glycerol-3-phosphate responsive antiterminator [Ruminococcaceae bacterium OttesenSCG-928-L11]
APMGNLHQRLSASPVIAAVKDEAMLDAALASGCEIVFMLTGNICTIEDVVRRIQSAGKEAYIHLDLMEGFGRDKHTIRYIKERIGPDGIITTRTPLAKTAREYGLTTIQRLFLIDNLSIETGIQSVGQVKPDAIEIMPGIMPKIVRRICSAVQVPVIAGGLINEKEDIIGCLGAGAVGISTSKQELWDI